MEYYKTKDPYHVKHLLGHKSIKNTEIYINLEQAIFNVGESCKYTFIIAKTVKGARALLEAGFEYVTDLDGTSSSESESSIATQQICPKTSRLEFFLQLVPCRTYLCSLTQNL